MRPFVRLDTIDSWMGLMAERAERPVVDRRIAVEFVAVDDRVVVEVVAEM